MQYELDNFLGSITMEAPPDYARMNASIIHNPSLERVKTLTLLVKKNYVSYLVFSNPIQSTL